MGDTGVPREAQSEPEAEAQPDVLASGREEPGALELWSALPSRLRRTAVTAGCLALLAAGAYAVTAQTSGAQPPGPPSPSATSPSPTARPVPYPAQTARITFTRLRLGDPAKRTFTVELHAEATSPLSVLLVSQSYEAVDLRLAERTPVTVTPGEPETLILKARVTSCEDVPLRARSPFLDVTLRNERARQKVSVIPGQRYARSLTHAFRTVCGPSRSPSAPNP